MAFNKGDFILVEYTVRVKETGALLDTTNAELAKQENIYDASKLYGPTLIVLGKNWINSVVEDWILNASENSEGEIEVPPDKAFGERDPNKVKVYSLRELQRRGYVPSIGDVIELNGVKGIVKQISGGRVTIDFNHPLAGKTLVYKVKIIKKLEDFEEKIKALTSRHLRIPQEDVTVIYDSNERKLTLSIPGRYISRENINYAKLTLAADLFAMFKNEVQVLVFSEVLKPVTNP
ncbi:MAG: peptidylprolyl isomerase [Desulfurococcaceae archaeon]|nr:peptidylprolyl isomerase [Desulfurococcaceae archaeon]